MNDAHDTIHPSLQQSLSESFVKVIGGMRGGSTLRLHASTLKRSQFVD